MCYEFGSYISSFETKQHQLGFRQQHLPKATVCLVLERIFRPIRPYIITIITIGNAKKTHVDTSHSGNLSGLSSIAQNAESRIFSLAVNEKKMKCFPMAQVIALQRLTLRIRQVVDFCKNSKRHSTQETHNPQRCNYSNGALQARHRVEMKWMTNR